MESLSTYGRSPEVDSPECDTALSSQSYLSDQYGMFEMEKVITVLDNITLVFMSLVLF